VGVQAIGERPYTQTATGDGVKLTYGAPAPAPAKPPTKAGDVVRLKFGGPLMTVTSFCEGSATTVWFGSDGNQHTDQFVNETLQLVE
jgi:uncharacterized protein YodC (DUF2158 family)